jgi:hypothetical protein
MTEDALDECARVSAWHASPEASRMRAAIAVAACDWLMARKPPDMESGRFIGSRGWAVRYGTYCREDKVLAEVVSSYLIAAVRARVVVLIGGEKP